ncbi:mitofusin [Tieghemiomyces parasiticus]|uniref:Mitofusin n=1 Tax=Tieghemiomyces parasiticus TaxID=78921 RepID=A0A9W8E1S4_9FUNG|nr:mitofusin [Tieghemiomyces parasiticus]
MDSSLTTSVDSLPRPVDKDYALHRQRIFQEQSQKLLTFIRDTQALLEDLRQTNRSRFQVQYPQSLWHPDPAALSSTIGGSAALLTASASAASEESPRWDRRRSLLSEVSALDSSVVSDVGLDPTTPQALKILKLDLRLAHRASAVDGSSLVGSLEQGSIANLFDEQLAQSLAHLARLHARVADRSSKVLVTGDLNAGKSTLVNALLRRDILPWDQQPCTMLFCEVLDAGENGGQEAIHAVWDNHTYDPRDSGTFVLVHPDDLDDVVMDNPDNYQLLKVYTVDGRTDGDSLLRNGVADLALIDSPGLNRDSLKTTQLFTRQEEIDVIVFVVNSENHFTLSGQEFLTTAGKEKAYIFIVVNKFDSIRNKDRCRRLILEQIKQLSPHTYANAPELVHFVSATHMYAGGSGATGADPARSLAPEFSALEECLRSFTLEKRFTSKLAPAQRYLLNVLDDLLVLSRVNHTLAAQRVESINEDLKTAVPVYQSLLSRRQSASESANRLLDAACELVRQVTLQRLDAQLRRFSARAVDGPVLAAAPLALGPAKVEAVTSAPSVSSDEATLFATPETPVVSPTAVSTTVAEFHGSTESALDPDDLVAHVPWPGLLYTFHYIAQLKAFLLSRMEQELQQCELFTEDLVDRVTQQINDLMPEAGPRKPVHIPWDTIEEDLAAATAGAANGVLVDHHHTHDTARPIGDADVVATLNQERLAAEDAAAVGLGFPSVSLFDFSLSLSDLVDLRFEFDAAHLLSVTGASLGTFAMVASKLPLLGGGVFGPLDALARLARVGGFLGTFTHRGMRYLTLAGAALAGASLVVYLTADLDRTIRRRMVERLQRQSRTLRYAEHQSHILLHATHRAVRPFVWDVQTAYQHLIEHEERERAQKLEKRFVAEESRDYYRALIKKSDILSRLVNDVGLESE